MISVQYCNMNSVRKLANTPGFLSRWVVANQTQSRPCVFQQSCICKQQLERQQQAKINVRPPARLKSQTIKAQSSDKILIRGYWYGNTLSFVNNLLLDFWLHVGYLWSLEGSLHAISHSNQRLQQVASLLSSTPSNPKLMECYQVASRAIRRRRRQNPASLYYCNNLKSYLNALKESSV